MEGSTFRNVAAAARSVFRIKQDELDERRAPNSGTDVRQWEVAFGVVLKTLSRFPEAYEAVTLALKENEAGP